MERYIKDDVVRYGGRLSDLERKLGQVYQEHLEAEAGVVDDDELFADDGEALMRFAKTFTLRLLVLMPSFRSVGTSRLRLEKISSVSRN